MVLQGGRFLAPPPLQQRDRAAPTLYGPEKTTMAPGDERALEALPEVLQALNRGGSLQLGLGSRLCLSLSSGDSVLCSTMSKQIRVRVRVAALYLGR